MGARPVGRIYFCHDYYSANSTFMSLLRFSYFLPLKKASSAGSVLIIFNNITNKKPHTTFKATKKTKRKTALGRPAIKFQGGGGAGEWRGEGEEGLQLKHTRFPL